MATEGISRQQDRAVCLLKERGIVRLSEFHAMVLLGRANSRMKDFYDIWVLSRSYEFAGESLARAIAATFARRKTNIPVERPEALTGAFAGDAAKRQQWTAFVEGIEAKAGSLAEVVEAIAAFLLPVAGAAQSDGDVGQVWAPGGPWRAKG